jgi:hypothetical protein
VFGHPMALRLSRRAVSRQVHQSGHVRCAFLAFLRRLRLRAAGITLRVFVCACRLFLSVRFRFRVAAITGTLGPAICDVPTRTLEDDANRLNDAPDESATFRTFLQRVVSKFLNGVKIMSTCIAVVAICRHRSLNSPQMQANRPGTDIPARLYPRG